MSPPNCDDERPRDHDLVRCDARRFVTERFFVTEVFFLTLPRRVPDRARFFLRATVVRAVFRFRRERDVLRGFLPRRSGSWAPPVSRFHSS